MVATVPASAHKPSRRAVRVDRPLEVVYSCNSPPIRARTQDVSDSGAFVDTHHPLTEGAPVDLEIDLGDGHAPVRARGRVVWSAPMMGSGIEFTDISDDDRLRLRFFVAETFFSGDPDDYPASR